ncbi:hypothetical protein F8388_016394 [Cannabis sativa]|uniref:Uncharacterized protein n=1 Tax=Cannabis sativa TaxID=3483 RepID=A0A7J6GT78_CANSA|nr:hypothetical protein F8388_016394 [Cannabis sativa]
MPYSPYRPRKINVILLGHIGIKNPPCPILLRSSKFLFLIEHLVYVSLCNPFFPQGSSKSRSQVPYQTLHIGLASNSPASPLELGHPVSVTTNGMFSCPDTAMAQITASTITSKRFRYLTPVVRSSLKPNACS